ncbi:MAG TPA: PAS domain S-box protein [Candidatus Paceibacterota bacterium]|nr:PAS domain S-box protein [Candidatus Paceibacterota bacterium]
MNLAFLCQNNLEKMKMTARGVEDYLEPDKKYSLNSGLVFVDEKFNIIYASPNIWDIIDLNLEHDQGLIDRLEQNFHSIPLKNYIIKSITNQNGIFVEETMSTTGKYFLLAISASNFNNGTALPKAAIISLSDITPLQTSEKRFRTLSDVLPQLIWTNDEWGNANYFNARWYEYSGLTFENSYGLGWQAMVHPEDAETSISKWQESLASGNIFETEYRLRDATGKYRWHIGRNIPVKSKDDKITGWYGTATDVHALKHAESSLREREEQLRVTMESATDYAIITTDIDGVIRGWSAGAERIFGYTPKEVIGFSADIIFTEGDRKRGAPDKEMRHAREFGRAIDERWHLRKDGTVFFMSGVMTPIQSSSLTGYVKVARDLTDRRAFEQKLLNSEERYRIALEAAEMIAWDYDILADKIVWNNETEFTGTDASDNKLSLFMSFVYDEDKKYVEEKMGQALEQTGIFQAEFRIYTPTGRDLRWMNSYGKALRNDSQKAYRLVGVMYDITKRKILEAQKEEFIGIASHELKTPVTSIKAYTEVLEQIIADKNDPVTASLVSKLNSQVDRLNDLIKELLDTTKISEGQLILKFRRFDLNTLIKERVDELQVISQKHYLQLDLCFDGMITADPDLIAQAVTNLVSNAIKYSPKAGDILITTRRLESAIQVSVTDSGIGIPASDKEKVFQRFFRVATPSVQTFPGMGLGLYITAGIINRHNGTISVESEPGSGSTFTFILPDREENDKPSPEIKT